MAEGGVYACTGNKIGRAKAVDGVGVRYIGSILYRLAGFVDPFILTGYHPVEQGEGRGGRDVQRYIPQPLEAGTAHGVLVKQHPVVGIAAADRQLVSGEPAQSLQEEGGVVVRFQADVSLHILEGNQPGARRTPLQQFPGIGGRVGKAVPVKGVKAIDNQIIDPGRLVGGKTVVEFP